MKGKSFYITVGLSALIFHSICTPLYRYYIHQNDLYDFHIADMMGNIIGVIVASSVFIVLSAEEKFSKQIIIACMTCMGLIAYEFLQIFLPWTTFDFWDIFGSLLGLAITCVCLFLHDIFINKEI